MKRNLEDLEKLNDLLQKGILSEEEYKREKEKILNGSTEWGSGNLFGLDENTYGFLIHASVLLGFIHVALGLIAPIVLWALGKQSSSQIDQHGKYVLNWIFSFIVYMAICFFIVFPLNRFLHLPFNFSYNFSSPITLFSGFIPITILMVLNMLFIVIGAIKALSGKTWHYPLSIRFF